MSSTPQDQYLAVCKELERLRKTLNDHLLSESAETMRADKAEADLAAKDTTLGEMTGLARKAEANLAAARALLVNIRTTHRELLLRDQLIAIDAIIAGEKNNGLS